LFFFKVNKSNLKGENLKFVQHIFSESKTILETAIFDLDCKTLGIERELKKGEKTHFLCLLVFAKMHFLTEKCYFNCDELAKTFKLQFTLGENFHPN
jgi:hypothetical protein